MKKKNIILLIIVILLLFGFTICFLSEYSNKKIFLPTDENAQDWNGDQNLPNGGKKETNTIKIPGFDSLTFIAKQKTQQVNFKNPEGNNCLFRMTLFIDDKQYWQSAGGIEPGKGYYEIQLDEGLQSGDYDGTLLVECFKKDGTALNNAKVKFDLEVTEE